METQTEFKERKKIAPSRMEKTGYSWRRLIQSLGPGIIIAALVFGPTKITITTMLGAAYNYSLLWVVVIAIFFMAIFTTMAARIGRDFSHYG